jgi:hypothetical protein
MLAWFKHIGSGRRLLVYCICKDDLNFEIKFLVLVEKLGLLSRYLTRWVYDARILYVVARTILYYTILLID